MSKTSTLACLVKAFQQCASVIGPVRNVPWFICWLWRYINCFLFTYFSSLHSSFLILFSLLICFFIHLLSIFFFQNRPVPFSGQRSYEATKPGFVLYVLILCCSIFFKYACLLRLHLIYFFSTKPRDWLGRTSPKWPILYLNLNSIFCVSVQAQSCNEHYRFQYVSCTRVTLEIKQKVKQIWR